jgi:hypothetical protein
MGTFNKTFSLVQHRAVLNPFIPLITDGHTKAWYDYRDESLITKDGNNFVTKVANKLGDVNGDLDVVGGTPIWGANGVLYDGINDYLEATFEYNQPEQMYISTWYRQRAYCSVHAV